MSELVTFNLCDWNSSDKYYELPLSVLEEFAERIKKDGISAAWDWFTPQISYWQIDETWSDPTLPIKRVDHCTNHMLDEYFLDWCNPLESISYWEDE